MDGNGRWAEQRGKPRVWGHIRGVRTVVDIVEAANDLDIDSLTLYAFSTENFSRPRNEVKILFRLLEKFLISEEKKIIKNNIQFDVIGDLELLPSRAKSRVDSLKVKTDSHTGLKLVFAFCYGARTEIENAVNQWIKLNPGKPLNQEDIQKCLYRPDLNEMDLIIRTGGEYRLSNFLLWQSAYAELYFSPTFWPEFSGFELASILDQVSQRERRFGSIEKDTNLLVTKSQAEKNKESLVP